MRATVLADRGPVLMDMEESGGSDTEFIVVGEETDGKRRTEVVNCLNSCISGLEEGSPVLDRACAVRCMDTYNCTKITDTEDLLKYQC